jgi:hypothetical protein
MVTDSASAVPPLRSELTRSGRLFAKLGEAVEQIPEVDMTPAQLFAAKLAKQGKSPLAIRRKMAKMMRERNT